MDGKTLIYQNWGENAIKDGNSKCVQMSLAKSDLGKWTDDLCQKKYLMVCQKKQTTKTVLSEEIRNITKFIGKQQATIEKQGELIEKQQVEIESIIPLGFLYTQLPRQLTPQQLWPHINWIEVTKEYAGLFFRAEGGRSEKFGVTQASNQTWISNLRYGYANYDAKMIASTFKDKIIEIFQQGVWNNANPNDEKLFLNLDFFITEGETRPINTAIKIWKRIQ